jgi:hypothetical protein
MFRKAVDNNQNGVEPIREGEFDDEVCGDFLPWTRRRRNRLEKSRRFGRVEFRLLTRGTGLDKLCDVASKCVPIVVA